MRIKLNVSKERAQEINYDIAALLGDNIHSQRRDIEDVIVPEELEGVKGMSSATRRTTDSIGQILTFRNDGPFATLTLWFGPEDGVSYGLGGFASWNKQGTKEDLDAHRRGLGKLLSRFDAYYPQYEFSCPCGHSATVGPSHKALREAINEHKAQAHSDSRTSTMTLVEREITPLEATGEPAPRTSSPA